MRISKYKCDQCGVEQDQQSYGGLPFIPYTQGRDFCTEQCLYEYLRFRLLPTAQEDKSK